MMLHRCFDSDFIDIHTHSDSAKKSIYIVLHIFSIRSYSLLSNSQRRLASPFRGLAGVSSLARCLACWDPSCENDDPSSS